MDPLLDWRQEFPILESTVYMISHSLGAMPRRTRDRLNEYADQWATRGIRAWEEGWWELPVRLGDLIGKIIGAGPGEVIMQPNVSLCQTIALSTFDWSARRNKIVSEAMNFPSNIYIYQAAERAGARLVTVPSPDGIVTPVDDILRAIDQETALVSLSHVCYRSSSILDITAITRRAHEMGAMVIADIYQSAGTVPVDVGAMNVDFATGGSVKWLLGGPGAGYLYVRRDLWQRLEPRVTGWAAHRSPFEFADRHEYAPDMFRFGHGTPNVPAMYAAMSGYEIINEIGVENIRAKSIRQTTRLIEMAEEAGFRVNCPKNPAERGGTVVIDVPNGGEINRELTRRNFLADFRPGAGIRVAPHFYSTDEECERMIKEIVNVIETSRAPVPSAASR
jgi:kynureninase